MKIISYIDFLLEGKRADAINLLTTKYNGNKEQALQDITSIENKMMQMYNNKGLVNKYIFSVMNFIESSDNTGHAHDASVKNVLSDLKRLIDWEPRMKQQNRQLTVDQLDKMSWIQFNKYLNDFYDAQPHDKWKSKYKKEINVKKTESAYEIIHIPNWRTAKRYRGNKLTWCVTQSEDAFLQYTQEGEQFVFAFKPDYEQLNEYHLDQDVYRAAGSITDEFALSALAIRIHSTGNLTVTCRYNHEAGGNDNVYGDDTTEILKDLGIYDALQEVMQSVAKKRKAAVSRVYEILRTGTPLTDEMADEIMEFSVMLTVDEMIMFVESDANEMHLYHLFQSNCGYNEKMEFMFRCRASKRAREVIAGVINPIEFGNKYADEITNTWKLDEIARLDKIGHNALEAVIDSEALYNRLDKVIEIIRYLYDNNIYCNPYRSHYFLRCVGAGKTDIVFKNLDIIKQCDIHAEKSRRPTFCEYLYGYTDIYMQLLDYNNAEFNKYVTTKSLNLIVPVDKNERGKEIPKRFLSPTIMIKIISEFIRSYNIKPGDYYNEYNMYINRVLEYLEIDEVNEAFEDYIH